MPVFVLATFPFTPGKASYVPGKRGHNSLCQNLNRLLTQPLTFVHMEIPTMYCLTGAPNSPGLVVVAHYMVHVVSLFI